jgi:hypothetical protein
MRPVVEKAMKADLVQWALEIPGMGLVRVYWADCPRCGCPCRSHLMLVAGEVS